MGLVPIVLLAAFWFLLLAPKREEATSASKQLTEQEQRRDSAQQQLNAAKGAKTDFAADYGEIVRLGKAIPTSVDMPSLLVQLDRAAAGTDLRFTKIATGDRTTAASTATPRRPRRPRHPRRATRPRATPPAARSGWWRAGSERSRWSRRGRQRHGRPAEPAGCPDVRPRRGRYRYLDLVRQRPAGRRRLGGQPDSGRARAGRTGDGAAGARVHGQLLQPRGLLPRREALRARRRARTSSSVDA